MEKVNKEEAPTLHLPEIGGAIRDNGEAVMELRQDGELVGEINFSKIFTNWMRVLGIGKPANHLKSV